MSVFFVTPAHGRFDLTAVCLEQRQYVIEELARHSIHAECVVIADDENLDTARALGMHTVERDNEWVSRKFNDGMQYAAEHGAEWIVPIGSDSWIDPAYFLPLPSTRRTRTSAMYSVVEEHRMAELHVGRNGAGPYMFHRSVFPPGFRPADEQKNKNIDSSTIRGMVRTLRWEAKDIYTLQYVGFRGTPHITKYENLMMKWGTAERDDPWERLAQHYPPELVERARLAL
jgi:hypothetical protein